MYLSRCEINPARRQARALLASPQMMHAAVHAGFPSEAQPDRLLWRVDRHAHSAMLYLVSSTKPDLTHVIEQAGWPTTQSWQSREYAPLLDSLALDQEWSLRLTANPTRSVLMPGKSRSQRVAHVTAQQQLQWLLDRAGTLGLDFGEGPEESTVQIAERGTREFRRNGQKVTVACATFTGRARVTDADALRRVLCEGVGPAKAYGCGLLTLAPL